MTTLDVSTSHHVCPKCQQEKPLTREFWFPDSRKSNGFKSHACRLCNNISRRDHGREYAQSRRKTDEGRLAQNAAMRKWKAANPEKRREERRKYAENKGKQYSPRGERQKDRQFIEQEYDKIIERNARAAFKWWFAKKTDDQVAAWYAASGKPWLNPRLSGAEKWRLRYRLDPEYHAHHIIRCTIKKQRELYGDTGTAIRNSLVGRGGGRKTELQLGYTMEELRIHLERQFNKKMTWEKFMNGEIHIDHILPKKSFDMSDPEEWKICWSLPNLRPLWANDNRTKSAKVLTLL